MVFNAEGQAKDHIIAAKDALGWESKRVCPVSRNNSDDGVSELKSGLLYSLC